MCICCSECHRAWHPGKTCAENAARYELYEKARARENAKKYPGEDRIIVNENS